MPEQKRKQPRLIVERTIFIELVSPHLGNSTPGKVARCKTLDISCDGLRVNLEQELTVGAILQIGVELPESNDTLYLAGEVRWSKSNEAAPPDWSTGFKLMNAVNSDIDRWVALVAGMEG